MKKLLSLLLIAGNCLGMEPAQPSHDPAHAICITEPALNEQSGLHEIQLFDGDILIGSLTYFQKNKEQDSWEIYLFRMHRDYRNAGLGTELFKAFVQDVKSKGSKVITWNAMPTDFIMNLDTLITIYKKIIKKLNFAPEALSISEPQGYDQVKQVTMTLRLT